MSGERTEERVKHRGGWDALACCGVLAMAAAVVAGFAWTRPTSTAATLAYTQSGQLSYIAPVSPASVYGSTHVTTGQPVYTDIVQSLVVGYRYRFLSTAPVALSGTEQLVATMSNGQGITRSLALQPPTPFQGDRFDATGTLDLGTLQAVAAQFASTTGAGAGTYQVWISPTVRATGQLGPEPLHPTFDPPMRFSLTTGALVPSGSSQEGTGLSASGTGSGVTETRTGKPGRPRGRSPHPMGSWRRSSRD